MKVCVYSLVVEILILSFVFCSGWYILSQERLLWQDLSPVEDGATASRVDNSERSKAGGA